jgi:2-methylcitrate dehydratase PrpD
MTQGRTPRNLSRRHVLQAGGGAMLAAAATTVREALGASAPAAISPTMTRLSTYMAEAGDKPLPAPVIEKTKQHVLDTLAAMVSGADLPPGRFAINFARIYKGEPVATVAASALVVGPIEAALVNGILAHADETDDTHPLSLSHPGAAVVPAALAAGERFGIDGDRFLRAVALGYDIGPRFTATLGRQQYQATTSRSTHALAGTFGAAAAAGCCARLSAQQMRWLLSYTAQQGSGIASWQRDTDHIEKAFDFGGMPARNGVTAALLVQAGGTGVDDVLSGADNFFAAFKPMNDPSTVIEALGERYEVMRTDIKKWTVGSPVQAPLDALSNLMQQHRFDGEAVQKLVVRVGAREASVVNARELPDISMQHLLAVMLADGTVTFESSHDASRVRDPLVLRQRAKISLVGDVELEKLLPRRVGIVEVTLSDGRTLSERVETVRGTTANPMTREEIIAKARDLMVPILSAAKFEQLTALIFALESVRNLVDLRPLLQRP